MFDNFIEDRERVLALKKLADSLLKEGDEELASDTLAHSRKISDRIILGNLPTSNILQDLCLLLKECNVKFAVIGGLATCVRGQIRSTEYIDVLVEKFPGVDKLRDSDYMGKFNFYRSKSSTGTVLVIDHRSSAGYVEMLLANDDLTKWAVRTATVENLLKSNVPVVSADALICLKVKASVGNKKRQVKDFPDILSVLLKNEVDLFEIEHFLNDDEQEMLRKLVNVVS